MNTVDKDIWNYIDGTCTAAERLRIEKLIAEDPAYETAYNEYLALDAELLKMDVEEPSMSFTRNVMETIKTEPVPGSLKSLIDKRIIYGISAFFILTFTVALAVLLVSVNWSQSSENWFSQIKMPSVNIDNILDTKYITAFYFADMVLALYILDTFLRKRLLSK